MQRIVYQVSFPDQTVGVELGEGWRGNIFNNKDGVGDVSAAGTNPTYQ